jgi:hypothetical protein
MRDAEAKWDRLTTSDVEETKAQAPLIARVEERYSLPHDVAEDVGICGVDKPF